MRRVCRKCGQEIVGWAFGSNATGWEHIMTCPKRLQGTINGVFSYRDDDDRPWVIVDEETTEADLDAVVISVAKSAGVCCHMWMASRADTIHETMPVEHICMLGLGHERNVTSIHRCGCGATSNSEW